MTTTANIILMIIAMGIALERLAFSTIRKHDREAGLYLNDKSYTIFGTLKLLFLDQEKRIEKETEESFTDYLDRNEKDKKSLRWFTIGYCAVMALLAFVLFIRHGISDYFLMNLCLVAVGGCFLVSKSGWLVLLMAVYGLLSGIYGFAIGLFIQLTAFIAGLVMAVKFVIIWKSYRKNRKTGSV